MRGEALKEQRGGVRAATLVGSPYVGADGTVVLDVVDVYGNVWTGCPLIGQGGGASTFVHTPPATGAVEGDRTPAETGGDILISFFDGAIPHPVVIGTAQSQLARGRFAPLDRPADSAAYPAQNDPRDIVMENNGARVVVSHFGRVVLSTTSTEQPIEIAASPREYVWLSLGEASTDNADRLLLATPTRAYVDALVERVNALDATLVYLQNTLKGLAAAAALVPPPKDPAFAAFASALAAALQTATIDPVAATTDALNASAVRISPASEAEE